ncbi:MAG: HK97 gp10 family phage protein [Clostridiales bacterium]|nr:HK97 gp10 family phage protein [Clostridiales bacterium]
MSINFDDNTDIIDRRIKEAVKQSLKEIGIKATAEIKSNCPVDTGTLRRSYTYKCNDFDVTVGTAIDYSVYVEFKPSNRGGRPHFRRSLESLEQEFINILKRNLGAI